MRRHLLSLLAATACFTAPAVHANDTEITPNFYFGGTLNFLHRNMTTMGIDANEHLGHMKYNSGLDYGLFMGTEFKNGLAIEVEYLDLSRGAETLAIHQGGFLGQPYGDTMVGGTIDTQSVMLNAWYKLYKTGNWHASIGAGIGANRTKLDGLSTSAGFIADGASGWGNGYQLMSKVGYDLSDNMEIALGYRYHDAGKATLTSTGMPDFTLRSKTHHVMARFTFKFNTESKKPVVKPEPKPEPKPVITPVPKPPVEAKPLPMPKSEPKPLPQSREYIVFFDFDKADISATAEAILKRAKADFDTYEFIKIDATGHTDSKGYKSYNMKLSLKRARAVQAKLVELGIAADKISLEAKGETDLLVKTGDAVKEPQNRRVQIVLKR